LVAIVLGLETSSLLVGEGASAEDAVAIRKALEGSEGVESVIHMKTLYLGPDELMLGAKIAVEKSDSAAAVARAIDSAEAAVRAAVPATRVIYLEPDILRASKN
jgi:divalent metal cation (Fe/Co/Zn/Cd) transporter